ncbi:hypothetical protein CsSME_00007950 [Camellia sinensis var. sinensis]
MFRQLTTCILSRSTFATRGVAAGARLFSIDLPVAWAVDETFVTALNNNPSFISLFQSSLRPNRLSEICMNPKKFEYKAKLSIRRQILVSKAIHSGSTHVTVVRYDLPNLNLQYRKKIMLIRIL